MMFRGAVSSAPLPLPPPMLKYLTLSHSPAAAAATVRKQKLKWAPRSARRQQRLWRGAAAAINQETTDNNLGNTMTRYLADTRLAPASPASIQRGTKMTHSCFSCRRGVSVFFAHCRFQRKFILIKSHFKIVTPNVVLSVLKALQTASQVRNAFSIKCTSS